MQSLTRYANRRGFRGAAISAVLALALCAPSAAGAKAAPFTARLTAPNHTPIANKAWPISVKVTRGSTKLSGSVKYEFLFEGQIVSHQPGKTFKDGIYKDTLTFPSPAIGQKLTLVILVTTKYGTVPLDWAVDTKA